MNVLVSSPPKQSDQRDLVRIVIAGHVDHGKSTLIGRLLHETGSLPDGKLESLKAISARRGMAFEWSFLLDALQTERDQGITIDTSQIRFRTGARDFVLIDAPGHVEFLRNMITGAAQADAAILMIDAIEGVRTQTRRHGYLLQLLGIQQVAVIVNKMDLVAYSQDRFEQIATEISDYLAALKIAPIAIVPISAREGDGISALTPAIGWYRGPTVLEALQLFHPGTSPSSLPLRLPVQAVYKFDDRRIIVGRIESGFVSAGDKVVIMPGEKTAYVKSIESWPVPGHSHGATHAEAGRSVGITLDRALFVERGHIISLASSPSSTASDIRARVFWLHPTPLENGMSVTLRSGTAESRGRVSRVIKTIDPETLGAAATGAISANNVGEVEIALARPISADPHNTNPVIGRFALEVEGRIAGGGLILDMEAKGARTTLARAPLLRLDEQARTLSSAFTRFSPLERMTRLRNEIEGRIILTTSFGIEDQAILQMICEADLDIEIVTIDTGRLFPQTYDLWAQTERHFGRRIRAVYPRHLDLEALVEKQGINGF